jgi:hypothetical protein
MVASIKVRLIGYCAILFTRKSNVTFASVELSILNPERLILSIYSCLAGEQPDRTAKHTIKIRVNLLINIFGFSLQIYKKI